MVLFQHPTNSISDRIIGAAIEVHRHLGPGLLESSYQACLCRELELRAIRHRSQLRLPLEYKGVQLPKGYIIDLLVEGIRNRRNQGHRQGSADPFVSAYYLHAAMPS